MRTNGKNKTVGDAIRKFNRERKLSKVFEDIRAELARAEAKYPPMNSAHEGFAVIDEERDELKAEIRIKDPERDLGRMRDEATQIASSAVRFILDVCDKAKSP